MTIMFVAIACIAVALSGCGGDDSDGESTATAAAPSSSPTAVGGSDVPPIVAEVNEAVTSGDPAQLEALFEYQNIPCTTDPPSGSGGPPLCVGDEADAALVEVLFSATCEGNYVRREDIEEQNFASNAVATDSELYAAYEYKGLDSMGGETGYGSNARYFVLFSRPEANPSAGSGTGYAIVTSDQGVLGIHYGCGSTPQDFANFNELGPAVVEPN
jgi:hypothetical protein